MMAVSKLDTDIAPYSYIRKESGWTERLNMYSKKHALGVNGRQLMARAGCQATDLECGWWRGVGQVKVAL